MRWNDKARKWTAAVPDPPRDPVTGLPPRSGNESKVACNPCRDDLVNQDKCKAAR